MQQLWPLLQQRFLDAPECRAHTWAAWYNTWLIKLTPKGVTFLPFFFPELTLIAMQGFLQRCQNYLSKAVVEQFIMRLARNNQQQFMQESGLRVRAYEQGFSTSAAAIIAADWALEYPHPIPPKVHVSLYHSARMHLVTSQCCGCQVHTQGLSAVYPHATHLSVWCVASHFHQITRMPRRRRVFASIFQSACTKREST